MRAAFGHNRFRRRAPIAHIFTAPGHPTIVPYASGSAFHDAGRRSVVVAWLDGPVWLRAVGWILVSRPAGWVGADAGHEVFAGSDAELIEDVAEVELDGLDADVQLGGGLPVGAAGGDQPGHRLLGRGEAGQRGRGLGPRGYPSGGELPVADPSGRTGRPGWSGAAGPSVLLRAAQARQVRARAAAWPRVQGPGAGWSGPGTATRPSRCEDYEWAEAEAGRLVALAANRNPGSSPSAFDGPGTVESVQQHYPFEVYDVGSHPEDGDPSDEDAQH